MALVWGRSLHRCKRPLILVGYPNFLVALVSIVHEVSWSTGPPGHEPAVEFLQSIHQNQTVETVRNALYIV